MPKDLSVPRTKAVSQPSVATTLKGQSRFRQTAEYDPEVVKTEFDYAHERLNQIVESMPAVAALASNAVLSDVIAKINELIAALNKSALTPK